MIRGKYTALTEQQILDQYEAALTALFALALAREIERATFEQQLDQLVTTTLITLFLTAGAHPDELDNPALVREIAANRQSARNLARDIWAGRYDEREEPKAGYPVQTAEQGEAKLANRLLLWVRKAGVAVTLGAIFKPVIDRLVTTVWRVGATDHCVTCLGLDGVVLTREEWQTLAARGIYPRSSKLACRGFHCQCSNDTIVLSPSEGLANVTVKL